jgi:hypothetical protein
MGTKPILREVHGGVEGRPNAWVENPADPMSLGGGDLGLGARLLCVSAFPLHCSPFEPTLRGSELNVWLRKSGRVHAAEEIGEGTVPPVTQLQDRKRRGRVLF